MDNPETLATLGIKDTEQEQKKTTKNKQINKQTNKQNKPKQKPTQDCKLSSR
jgi:hypothetical protein